MGAQTGRGWLEGWKERLDRWLEALDNALAPRPEPVPVPVRRPAKG